MSGSFVFRLEAVLQQRRHEEDAFRLQLADIIRARASALEHLDTLQEELMSVDDEVRSVGIVHLEGSMTVLYYRDRAVQSIAQQQNVITDYEGDISTLRVRMLEATHRRQVLERLRARKEVEFRELVEKRAERAIDELITMTYQREDRHEVRNAS